MQCHQLCTNCLLITDTHMPIRTQDSFRKPRKGHKATPIKMPTTKDFKSRSTAKYEAMQDKDLRNLSDGIAKTRFSMQLL